MSLRSSNRSSTAILSELIARAASEVDVGRGQVAQALVVAQVIVVGDEGADPGLESAGQVVVLQQDAVLQRLVPALDLALGHGVIGSAADVIHVVAVEP